MRLVAALTVPGLVLVACGGDAGPTLARPSIDTLPGWIIAVHNTGPAGWADTNGWRFVETGRLVATDEEDSPIINPDGIEMDAAGRLYVIERQPRLIKVLDPNGTLIRTIGRDGAGPGEYRSVLAGVSRSHLVVQDPNLSRLTIFDTSGVLLGSYPSACCHFRDLPVTLNGDVFIPGPNRQETFSDMFLHFTVNGEFVDTVYSPKGGEESFWEYQNEGGRSRYVIPYTAGQAVAFAPGGEMVHGWTADYRIAVGRNALDTLRVFTLDWTPVERPERERRAFYDPFLESRLKIWGDEARQIVRFEDIPAMATPFSNLMVDPAGAIWATVYTGDSTRTDFDVFDSVGVYQGRVVAPWRGGGWGLAWGDSTHVARLSVNEEGYPEITTYRLERTVREAE